MGLLFQNFDIKARTGIIHVKRIMHNSEKQKDRPTITFLHEGLGCIGMWHDFPEAIAQSTGLDTLIFDRHGHGKSAMLSSGNTDNGYIEREAWEHLPEILDLCNVRKTLFFGHSDGGTIALLYASRHPNHVLGIISESAHTSVDDLTITGIKKAVKAFDTSNLRDKLFKYHFKNTDFLFRRWANTWLSEKHLNWNIEKHLKTVKCPVIVIHGIDDHYGTKRQPDSIAENVSGLSEKLMVPECRHVPHHEKRLIVTKAVSKFITREIL